MYMKFVFASDNETFKSLNQFKMLIEPDLNLLNRSVYGTGGLHAQDLR